MISSSSSEAASKSLSLYVPPSPSHPPHSVLTHTPQCDIIYTTTASLFGLPEIKIGTIPGAGGTQRLARALGKHKAMELILTGDTISGEELARLGVINKAFPSRDQVLEEAMGLAARMARMSGLVTRLAKKAVLIGEFGCFDSGMNSSKSGGADLGCY